MVFMCAEAPSTCVVSLCPPRFTPQLSPAPPHPDAALPRLSHPLVKPPNALERVLPYEQRREVHPAEVRGNRDLPHQQPSANKMMRVTSRIINF